MRISTIKGKVILELESRDEMLCDTVIDNTFGRYTIILTLSEKLADEIYVGLGQELLDKSLKDLK